LYGLKMQEGSDWRSMNVFNQIITDLARLDVSIEDEDRAMILCSLYEHLVTTLTYGKETDEITAAGTQPAKTECRENSHSR
ncbi:UNVERIFIED_CONTAM: hypothetical protein Slati_4180900, partial [Sesamum latifolium]